MPIDPSILQQVQIPQPPSPAQQAQAEEIRARQQARLDALRDQRDIQTALQQSVSSDGQPDFEAAIGKLQGNPRAMGQLLDLTQKMRKQQSEDRKAQLENETKEAEYVAHLAQGLTPENYATVYPMLPPAMQQVLGETFDPKKRDFLVATGQGTKEFNDKANVALEHYLKGDWDRAIAEQVAVQPGALGHILEDARNNWNAPASRIEFWKNIPPDQLQQTARDLALGTEKRETLALTAQNQQADNARQDAHNQVTEAQADAAAAERARHNKAMETKPTGGSTSPAAAGSSDAKAIADAIADGSQPPEFTGLYRMTAPVRAELARKGYDLTKATEDWKATQKYFGTLNGAQQVRLRQAVTFANDSLDIISDLNGKWKGGRFPLLNKAQLALAKNGAMGKDAQQLATQLDAQISDLVSELGTVYKGGNSSTDESLKLAAENLKSNWSQAQLDSAITLVKRNLQIRTNSIRNTGVVANQGNAYAPQTTAPSASKLVYDPKTGTFKKAGQ